MNEILSKTLVTGSNGSVASYIDFGIKVGRSDFDISDMEQTFAVVQKYKPSVILHLAAETNLEKCETDPAHAYLVNAAGTYNLALAAKKIGARMVYVSTDAVFSGSKGHPYSEEDQPGPSSIYGHSKYLGELAVRSISEDNLIVRTSWVFGGGPAKDKKFVAKIIKQLDQDEIVAVNDQSSSPTFAKDLAGAIKQLIIGGEKGVIHVTNDGVCSRYQVALEIVNLFKSKARVKPVGAETFNLPEHLRSSGGLISVRTKLRPWQDALSEYLLTEWKK